MTRHTHGSPHRPRIKVPTICGSCKEPERLVGLDQQPRPLTAYVDASSRRLVGWLCSECERMLVAANHQIARLAQGIIFLSGGGSVPAVVDVVAT